MSIKVLVAEDGEGMRRALSMLLTDREEIAIVGEARSLPEAYCKTVKLKPDIVAFDLHMSKGVAVPFPSGSKVLAISFTSDRDAQALANDIGATRLLDALSLSTELVPAILQMSNGAARSERNHGERHRVRQDSVRCRVTPRRAMPRASQMFCRPRRLAGGYTWVTGGNARTA